MPCCRKSCCLPEWASPEPSDAISRLRHNRPPHKGRSFSRPFQPVVANIADVRPSAGPAPSRVSRALTSPSTSSGEERPLASSMHVAEPWTRQHAGPRPSSAVLGREAARGLVLRTICAAWASASLRRASANRAGAAFAGAPTAAMRWAGGRRLPHPFRKPEETVGSCDNPLGCRRIAVADYPLPRGEHRRQVRPTVSQRRIGSRTRLRRDANPEILLSAHGLATG